MASGLYGHVGHHTSSQLEIRAFVDHYQPTLSVNSNNASEVASDNCAGLERGTLGQRQ
jgi:hypothetical protein